MTTGDSAAGADPRAAGFVIVNTAGARMVPAMASAIREASVCHGLSPADGDELREASEALLRRIASGIGDADACRFEITIHRHPGRVVVRIDDSGVPYELADEPSGRPQAATGANAHPLASMRELVDRIDYEYRGREGNRVELTKRTARRGPTGDDISAPDIDPDQPVEVREMVEDDAVPFVRNVYRSFGYTYAGGWAYRAEDVDHLLESGHLAAWVAATAEGAIVGHAAIKRDPPGAKIGEGGAAVVDPEFRHHGIAVQLGMAALEWAQREELFGLFAYATAVHPHSQQAVVDLGGRELGLLLEYVPASVSYRAIDERGERRSAVMIMYLGFGTNPDQEVHAPPRHREILRRIWEEAKLGGSFVEPNGDPRLDDHTRVGVSIETDRNLARLDVTRIGPDVSDAVRLELERLEQGGIVAAYVDLPLAQPGTPFACESIEALGLFFAGVFPCDDAAGLRLRLQYVGPDAVLDRDDIKVASDFGAELRDYVLDSCS